MRAKMLAVLLVLSAVRQINAEERPVIGEGFVLFPVTTLLQRMQLARNGDELPRIRAYIAVNGASAIAEDGSIDAAALPLDDIRKALSETSGRAEGAVAVALYLDAKSSNPAAGTLVEMALESLGSRSGFKSTTVRVTRVNGRLDWGKTVGWATQPAAGPPNDDETPIGDEHVQVFPVRTEFSRFLTQGADCVIEYSCGIPG